MVDIDGVLSLFGSGEADVEGSFHSIEGIAHYLSATAAAHLLALAGRYEPVWASGWEEKANEYLPQLLGLPGPLPYLRFPAPAQAGRSTHAHWKLQAIEAHAGARPLAWVDDAFNQACHTWARARTAPTLLVSTTPQRGLTAQEANILATWADELER